MLTKHFDTRTPTDAFRTGMSRFSSSVSLITGQFNGNRAGLTATSIVSVCADPPTLLACVNQNASAHDAIDVTGNFCVNLIAADDLDIALAFSDAQRREERFKTGAWQDLPSGPMLLSAIAVFECRIMRRMPFETHTIFFGAVTAVYLADSETSPLIYAKRSFYRAFEHAPA
jgi:flavin reductase (DIM6/NTAB) family NADH-FMN oxidoreductase RutF